MSSTGTRLDPILAAVRERALARRQLRSVTDLRRDLQAEHARRTRFVDAFSGPKFGFIAECKRASPSAGSISSEVDLLGRAKSYAQGGANAVSVLTEQDHFDGCADDLARVAAAGLPRLRKDFILDEGMVLESVGMGADAILLMAVCLPGQQLQELRSLAAEAGLATLVEAHNEEELERSLAVDPDLIGINARDLTSFVVDVANIERLLPLVPEGGPVRVAESGVRGLEELRRVRAAGADAALVGEALMRTGDPAETLRQWREALDAH
ncbi:MAG: indole-3-glycerol phosphate synthase [Planctomycetota bacterium]